MMAYFTLLKASPKDEARIEAYWADVRAGIAKAQKHDFGTDPEQRIRANRTKALEHIEAAGRLMTEVYELCEAE